VRENLINIKKSSNTMGSNSVANPKDVVLVTGFGPFGEHKTNASWESVKLLSATDIEKELGIQLVTMEIPVEYNFVQQNIPALWDAYKPQVDSKCFLII
jgi:hypothetical protein